MRSTSLKMPSCRCWLSTTLNRLHARLVCQFTLYAFGDVKEFRSFMSFEEQLLDIL
jgi:aminopeptidase C